MVFSSIRNYTGLSLLFLAMACGNKQQQPMQPPAPAITVQQITTDNAVFYDEYPAIVRALNEVELRPQVNGYVTGVYFTEGDKVRKGQKLYSIDQQTYEATYQQAQANLAVQEANLVKAQKDVDRYRELSKADAIAKQQVDNAEAAYEAALKQVEAAKATVRSVQTNVRYTTISAPFDGTIGISLVRLGAAVSAGQTVLNTISSDNPIAADITVDQKEIFRFTQLQAAGQKAKNDTTFTLAFGNDIYAHPGKITVIDRAVDAQTGTMKMRLTFPNPENALRSGMSARLRVLNNASQKAVLVPFKAVTEQLGEFFVYVIEKDTASQRKVVLGQQIGKNVIIRDGLKEGENIAVEGVQNLREGVAVTVAKPGAAPGAPNAAGAKPAGK